MSKPTNGLANAPRRKKPNPPPSPKSFEGWTTSPRKATRDMKEAFAASLQEKLAARGETYNTLQTALYGHYPDSGTPRSVKPRNWVRAFVFPNEEEAGYIAQYLGVPLSELMEHERPFRQPVIKKGIQKGEILPREPKVGNKPKKKYTNGHDQPDSRWLLPVGVEPPHVKFETSKTNPTLTMFELKGEVPPHVAMAIFSMANDHKRAEE